MQLECHYYGTYYMARQAGFSRDDAKVIAWAAETVDELDFNRVRELKEKGVQMPSAGAVCGGNLYARSGRYLVPSGFCRHPQHVGQ